MFFSSFFPISFLVLSSSYVFAQPSTGSYGFDISTFANNIGVFTSNNNIYLVNITLGGQNFTVNLDTGSADLWIDARLTQSVQTTNVTSIMVNETYGRGSAAGNIAFAELRVGEYVIPSQAFVNASALRDQPLNGIFGISFDVARIFQTLNETWGPEEADDLGRSFITGLFNDNPSLPNSFDVQLPRTTDMSEAVGTFIISEHALEYSSIQQAPKLPRVSPIYWGVAMDEMRVNGNPFAFNSSVPDIPSGKAVAVLDTGFSLPQLPKAAFDAIYQAIPGALEAEPGQWAVPCNATVDLSFVFGGQEYPVHPLDLTLAVELELTTPNQNVTVCVSAYQALTLDPAGFPGFDLILGDGFLRNVYASFDYGDFDPVSYTEGVPFIQLESTVDRAAALAEFRTVRQAQLATMAPAVDPATLAKMLNATTTTTTATAESDGDSAVSGAIATDDSEDSSTGGASSKYGVVAVALLGANLLVGVAILAVTLTICVRGMKGRSESRYAPVRFKEMSLQQDPEGASARYSD